MVKWRAPLFMEDNVRPSKNVSLFACGEDGESIEITGDISIELLVALLRSAEYVSREPGGCDDDIGILELFGNHHAAPVQIFINFPGEVPANLRRLIDGEPWIFEESTDTWNPSLFKRLDEIDWGDDALGTRVYGLIADRPIRYGSHAVLSRDKPITTVAQFWHTLTIPGLLKTKNLGRKAYERIQEVMSALRLPPIGSDTLPKDFPWERLGL